jgi:hypothetical protein
MDSRQNETLKALYDIHAALFSGSDRVTAWVYFDTEEFVKLSPEDGQDYVEVIADCCSLILAGQGNFDNSDYLNSLRNLVCSSTVSGSAYPIVVAGRAIIDLIPPQFIDAGVEIIRDAFSRSKGDVSQELRELMDDLILRRNNKIDK